jgi:hypothetical protein
VFERAIPPARRALDHLIGEQLEESRDLDRKTLEQWKKRYLEIPGPLPTVA